MAGALSMFLLIRGWSDRRIAFCSFLALWLTYGFMGPGSSARNPNAVSRVGLTFSILEDHSPKIDKFAPFTGDRAFFDGSHYSDKAPGLSFTALPLVAALVSGPRSAARAIPLPRLHQIALYNPLQAHLKADASRARET
jgi:hypothetical protein